MDGDEWWRRNGWHGQLLADRGSASPIPTTTPGLQGHPSTDASDLASARERAPVAVGAAAAAMTSTTTTTITNNNNPVSTITTASHQRQQSQLPAVGARPPQHSTGSASGDSGSHRGGGGGGGSGSGGGGGGGGGTNQACAACKYQRRKCNPDCPMAPYFPADQQRRFLNAHRLFGVSNILKTLRNLKPVELCDDAMRTLIYQAEMRAHDPVLGCVRVIVDLERQLELDTAELNAVLHHLALCRQSAIGAGASAGVVAAALPAGILDDPCADLDVTSSNQPLLLSAEQEVVDALYANQDADAAILQANGHHNQEQQSHHEQHHGQQQLYDYFYYDSTVGDDVSSKPNLDINVDNMQHFDFDTSYDAEQKVELTSDPMPVGVDEHNQIDNKVFKTKATPSLVDVFDMRQEQVETVDVNTDIEVKEMVDMNADIDVKTMLDVNVNIDVVKTMVDVNADIDDVKTVEDVNGDIGVKEELPEVENGKIVAGEAPQMAESSHCKLGLGFSSF